MQRYRNRAEAGEVLAKAVAERNFADPVVLALPRGGVPIAVVIAAVIGAPVDLVMVRKIGVPSQPELAAGAIVNGDRPELVVNEDVVRLTRLGRDDIDRIAERELEEIRRRRAAYLKGRAHVDLAGRTAIVVDDGIATGATMRAALKAVRRQGPARIVLAVPVAPDDSLAALGEEVDEAICPLVPPYFGAIGAYYATFDQLPDAEVIRLLDAASTGEAG